MISIIIRIILGSLIGVFLALVIAETFLVDEFEAIDISQFRERNQAIAELYPSLSEAQRQTLADTMYWSLHWQSDLPDHFTPVPDSATYENPWQISEEYRQAIPMDDGFLILGPDDESLINSHHEQAAEQLDNYVTLIMFVSVLLTNALLLSSWTRGVGRLQKLTKAFAGGDLAFRISEKGPVPLKKLIHSLHQMAFQLEQARNQQAVLMNALPHELRTPLARIRMACDMLQAQPEQHEKWLNKAQSYLDDMEQLVHSLLHLNRITGQSMLKEGQRIRMAGLVRDVVHQEARHDPRIQLVTDAIDPVIQGDEHLLTVVLNNLLVNACRYSQTEVIVRLQQSERSLVMTVSDDGPGFPEQALPHLLQPFNRGDESRSRQSGGFGLGLAIVDVIVRSHGGRVELSNLEEGGACVAICLPVYG